MSFLGKKSSKNDTSSKMKTLKVEFNAPKSVVTPKARAKKAAKPMNFSEWVESYVTQSKGNPV